MIVKLKIFKFRLLIERQKSLTLTKLVLRPMINQKFKDQMAIVNKKNPRYVMLIPKIYLLNFYDSSLPHSLHGATIQRLESQLNQKFE